MKTRSITNTAAALCLLLAMPALAATKEKGSTTPIAIASIARTTPVDFEKEILPIFRTSCLACHNRTTTKGGLILETPQTILKGGEDGPVVVPGKSADSSLLELSAHQSKPIMPPRDNKAQAPNLTGEQLGLVKLWIDQGATGEVRAAEIKWQAIARSFTPAYAAAITFDGQFAAVGRANQLHVYHLPSQRLLPPLTDPAVPQAPARPATRPSPLAHRDMIYSLAFSPDGERLASGSFGEVKIWARAAAAPKFAVTPAPATPVGAAAASPDGKWLAVGDDTQAYLVDAATGKVVKPLGTFPGPVRGLRFSPDGGRIACAGGKVLRVYAVKDGAAVAEVTAPADVRALAWTNAGKRIATGHADNLIRQFTLTDATPAALAAGPELKGHTGPVTALDSIATGNLLLSGSADGSVRLWDADKGTAAKQVAHGGPVTAVAARADGKAFASAGENGGVKLWDAAKGAPIGAEIRGDRRLVIAAGRADDAAKLAAADAAFFKGVLTKADAELKTQQERVKKSADTKAAADKGFAETEAKLKAAANEKAKADADAALKAAEITRSNAANEVELANAAVKRVAETIAQARAQVAAAEAAQKKSDADAAAAKAGATAAEKPVRALAFSADGLTFAIAGDDAKIHLASGDTGAPLRSVDAHKAPVLALAFAGDGAILSGSADRSAVVSDVADRWALERTIGTGDVTSPLSDRVNALAFSPDGRTLATGAGEPSRGGEIKLWDANTGSMLHDFKDVHSDAVLSLDFSHDGKRLASGAADRFVKVVDLTTRKLAATFEGHTHHVLAVSFKADGRALVSTGADGGVKVWDLVSGERKANVTGFSKEVTVACFAGIADLAVIAGAEGQVKTINEAGGAIKTMATPADHVHAGGVSADGKTFVCGAQSGTLYVFDVAAAKVIATLAPPKAE